MGSWDWETFGHYSDIIMSAMASQITSFMIVYSIVYSGEIKEDIKAPHHWPLWGEITVDWWIPRANGQWHGKCFHLMASSWNGRVWKIGILSQFVKQVPKLKKGILGPKSFWKMVPCLKENGVWKADFCVNAKPWYHVSFILICANTYWMGWRLPTPQ